MPAPPPQPSGGLRGGGSSIIDQFTGIAAVGCLIGAATVIVPLVWHWAFYVLPVAGFLAGTFAIRRGQRVGGTVAVILNICGAALTLIGLSR